MDIRSGKFIVIEGSDGSGKKTQFELLSSRLQAAGYKVDMYDFPRYEQTSAHFVKKYLAGEYGDSDSVNPYTASMFYALDRYEASFEIRRSLSDGHIVLANRFVGSNMAHQGAKFGTEGEKRGFFMWEDSLEFQLLGIPRPDLNIYLKVPAEVSYDLIIKRSQTSGVPLDEHEKDLRFLCKSVESYDLLCKLFPKDYILIDCTKNGQILPISKISDEIWQHIQPVITEVPKGTPKPLSHKISKQVNDNNRVKTSHNQAATESGGTKHTLLDAALLGCYANYDYERIKFETSPKLQAILKQYSSQAHTLEKTVTNFEKIFDKKIINSRFSAKKIKKTKSQVLSSLLPGYALGITSLTGDFTQPNGLTDEKLFKQIDNVIGSSSSYQPAPENDSSIVNLINVLPRNELDLLVPVVFSLNITNIQSLRDDLDEADYQRRSKLLKQTLLSNKTLPNEVLLKSSIYQIELNCSLAHFNQLLKFAKPNNIIIQNLSPILGYSIPSMIDDLALAEEYSECFDASVALYSHIQKGHGNSLAAYALLGGHKQRILINLDLSNIVSLITSQRVEKSVSGFVRVATKELITSINEFHPQIGDFLNSQYKTPKRTKNN